MVFDAKYKIQMSFFFYLLIYKMLTLTGVVEQKSASPDLAAPHTITFDVTRCEEECFVNRGTMSTVSTVEVSSANHICDLACNPEQLLKDGHAVQFKTPTNIALKRYHISLQFCSSINGVQMCMYCTDWVKV